MHGGPVVNLGLYGTLLDPDVRAAVLGESWRQAGEPARLHGWGRFYVEGRAYPGIRRQPGAQVAVLVLRNVGGEALARADAFEGEEYTRGPLDIRLAGAGSGACSAMFYLPAPTLPLNGLEWRYDEAWRARHLERYLRETQAAMMDFHARAGRAARQ